MKNFNKVILAGKVACDPDTIKTEDGLVVTTFALAINRKAGDQEVADFHRIVTFRDLAQAVADKVMKDMIITVEGSIVNRRFEDREGNQHYRTEIEADSIGTEYKKDGVITTNPII